LNCRSSSASGATEEAVAPQGCVEGLPDGFLVAKIQRKAELRDEAQAMLARLIDGLLRR